MPTFEVKNNQIILEKHITELDKFVLNLLETIEKYANYVIIGGYVSIFFGRSRATEDIDLFIEAIPYERFEKLYEEITGKDYEFTINNPKTLHEDYLQQGISVRIWRTGFPLLNLEVKFALKPSQKLALKNRITARFGGKKIYFGQIESQIAYKRYISKSQKDIEDARHLEIVFEGLDMSDIEGYRRIFEDEQR